VAMAAINGGAVILLLAVRIFGRSIPWKSHETHERDSVFGI
jgi:hypothetical protein